MDQKIKAIAIDLDGTWLREDCTISRDTFQTVQKAIDLGYVVIPTTGRSYRNARHVLEQYRGLRYFINANGTVCTDSSREEVVFSHAMPWKMAKEIYELTNGYSCFVEIYEGMDAYVDSRGIDFLYASGMPEEYCRQLLSTNVVEQSLENYIKDPGRNINKFHIVCGSVEDRNRLRAQIGQVDMAYPISTFEQNIEVVLGHHSKADGLKQACAVLGLERENIMAIGDSNNDYDMVAWAGLGVAMGNANARVKEAADFVSTSNQEDGVAYAIRECLGIAAGR